MTITNEEFKLNLEKLIEKRKEPMKNFIAAYEIVQEAEQNNNVTNLTNIGEAQQQQYAVETASPEQMQSQINKLSAIVLDLTQKLETGKGDGQ